jgi:hypothetical protein
MIVFNGGDNRSQNEHSKVASVNKQCGFTKQAWENNASCRETNYPIQKLITLYRNNDIREFLIQSTKYCLPCLKSPNTHPTRGFSKGVNHSESFVLIFFDNGFVLQAQEYQKASSLTILSLYMLKPTEYFQQSLQHHLTYMTGNIFCVLKPFEHSMFRVNRCRIYPSGYPKYRSRNDTCRHRWIVSSLSPKGLWRCCLEKSLGNKTDWLKLWQLSGEK